MVILFSVKVMVAMNKELSMSYLTWYDETPLMPLRVSRTPCSGSPHPAGTLFRIRFTVVPAPTPGAMMIPI